MTELLIPARDDIQRTMLEAPHRYKLGRLGRRVGKSRGMLLAGVTGHGSPEGEASPWPGIAQGVDVLWVALDFPQALSIWTEEIRPRFTGIAHLHESEHWCRLPPPGGTLYVRSSENIDSARGLGANLGGVLFDECAKYDLEYAWRGQLSHCRDQNG